MKLRIALKAVIGIYILLIAGCMQLGLSDSSRTKLYLLSATAKTADTDSAAGLAPQMNLGIGPVTLPEYLNRPQMIRQRKGNKIHASDFHQWAEPLQENITRVMAENLSKLTGVKFVHPFPWRSSIPIDTRVIVDIMQFVQDWDGRITLAAHWSIIDTKSKKTLKIQHSAITVKTANNTYDKMAAAMSRALAMLSGEISDSLTQVLNAGPRKAN
ncbi:MAG: membrane integrity-associated transporter subunit PqiC [Desulfobacteraceae bacterium]|nr:membrane integrity-associated transporter subunit PqiC [Desulfobacteraceae bacterium]